MQGKILPERSADEVYVGCDVSKSYLDIYVHPDGERFRVANDRHGLRRLKRAFAGRAPALIVMEATGKYHRAVCRSLNETGLAVAVVNPLRARLFAEACGRLAKTDRVDAEMLAHMGRALAPPASAPMADDLAALAELVRARNAATAERTALKNRLAAAAVAFLKAELRRRIAALDTHVARLGREIERRIAADAALARRAEILASIPGVGPVVAADLLVDMSELGRLPAKAAASLAGLAPHADDSGGRNGRRRIRGGRPQARRALYLAALSAARHEPALAVFYRRLRTAGKKPKVALVAVMRKLVILANTLLRENRHWHPIRP